MSCGLDELGEFFLVNFFFGFAVLISLSVIVCSRESGCVVGAKGTTLFRRLFLMTD